MAKVYEETRYWCDYCRIFVYNNRINREKHDNSPQHQANFKKKVDSIRREEKERQKLQPKAIQATSKSESFYRSSSANIQSESSPVTNVLNVKASSAVPKKQVLGLASLTDKPVIANLTQNQVAMVSERDSSSYNVDITASSGDLKRKIAEDELALQSFDGETITEPQVQENVLDIDLSDMFKKKKKVNK